MLLNPILIPYGVKIYMSEELCLYHEWFFISLILNLFYGSVFNIPKSNYLAWGDTYFGIVKSPDVIFLYSRVVFGS